MDLLFFGYGITCGWTSPSLMILKSDESPLPTGKITMEEASWVASLVNAGGALGTLFFGPITNKFGRKNPLIAVAIPTIVSHISQFQFYFSLIFLNDSLHFSFVGCWCYMRKMFITYMQHVFQTVS